MLRIFNRTDKIPKHLDLLTNVEREFSRYNIWDKCLVNKTLANKILKYIDNSTIIDKYYLYNYSGVPIPSYAISTGAKAALLLAFVDNPDSFILDTRECGYNAVQAIILYCHNGNIITTMLDTCNFIEIVDESDIDVQYSNKKFSTISDLNHYIEELGS